MNKEQQNGYDHDEVVDAQQPDPEIEYANPYRDRANTPADALRTDPEPVTAGSTPNPTTLSDNDGVEVVNPSDIMRNRGRSASTVRFDLDRDRDHDDLDRTEQRETGSKNISNAATDDNEWDSEDDELGPLDVARSMSKNNLLTVKPMPLEDLDSHMSQMSRISHVSDKDFNEAIWVATHEPNSMIPDSAQSGMLSADGDHDGIHIED